MKCKISITAETDLAAWVSREEFMAAVDQADLSCREAQVVCDWYHPDWFWSNVNGEIYFIPPAFGFWGGRLRGINGRHRAILLFRHLEAIPMLLVQPGIWPKPILTKIMQRKIRENEIVELPNLPVNTDIKGSGTQNQNSRLL